MPRTFIDKLLSGATRRTSELNVIDPGPPPEIPARLADLSELAPPVPIPHDYVKARTLLQTSIDKLFSRQAVLMREIAVRQVELYETNKTLEALESAAETIHREHNVEPKLNEAELADILSEELSRDPLEGDMSPEFREFVLSQKAGEPIAFPGPTSDDEKSKSLLREATAAPKGPVPHTAGRKPWGFA